MLLLNLNKGIKLILCLMGKLYIFNFLNNFYHEKINENNNRENINKIGINISKIYDQNGNDILSQKDIKYKIVSNKEMTIFEENKYMMYCKKMMKIIIYFVYLIIQ